MDLLVSMVTIQRTAFMDSAKSIFMRSFACLINLPRLELFLGASLLRFTPSQPKQETFGDATGTGYSLKENGDIL